MRAAAFAAMDALMDQKLVVDAATDAWNAVHESGDAAAFAEADAVYELKYAAFTVALKADKYAVAAVGSPSGVRRH